MISTNVALVAQLTFRHLRHQAIRMALTILATIAAACVVVWVVSGYDSLIQKFDEFADVYLGRYEFVVVPYTAGQEGRGTGALNVPAMNNRAEVPLVRFDAKLAEELRADPAIAAVDPILQIPARISKAGAPAEGGGRGRRRDGAAGSQAASPAGYAKGGENGPANTPARGAGRGRRGQVSPPLLVGTNAAEPPYELEEGRWIDPRRADAKEAAISSGYARQLKVKLGDLVEVRGTNGVAEKVTIVGIVQQRKALPPPPPLPGTHPPRGAPLPRGPAVEAVYVPLAFAEAFGEISGQYDLLALMLKPGYKAEEFERNWTGRLAQHSPIALLQSTQAVEQELDGSVASETLRGQAWMATGISLLAALFIIFSTLNMGVQERARELAMLRAVGCTRAQVAGMIVLEGLLLGLIGWGGGLLSGWGLLTLTTGLRPDLFPQGAAIGFWSVALSGACAVGGALAASALPAYRATRVKPLDAMVLQAARAPFHFPWLATLIGIALVTVNPILLFYVPMSDTARVMASTAVGFTSLGLGFILLAPAVILITENLLAPVVCRLFATDPQLLATQLTSNLWRTFGTTIALTLGLGLFIAMQTWGYSMLAPFMPGDWAPDAVAVMTPTGVPATEVDAVLAIKGIDARRSLPCIAEQTKFASDVTGAEIRATTARQDNCIMAGVDPDRALGGDRPVFNFPFVHGARADAIAKLKRGRFCLVPDAFERESGLTVGDKFGVIPPNHPEQVVAYEIAGVVSMAGWHWMSKSGLRNRDGGRSAAMMIVAIDRARDDLDVRRINAFWINYDGAASEEQIKKSLEEIAERNHDPALARRQGRGAGPAADAEGGARTGGMRQGIEQREGYSTAVALRSREETRRSLRERADGVIWLISQLPLVTLLVTSLGVVNTIIASIRARQWDLGVLRAVGVTRFGLFRMILCEAVLMGVAACLLSLGFGIVAGYCGTEISRYVNMRGGQITPLIIPWTQIGTGFAITLGLCLMAALWPAIRTGRAEPLRLLKAGRSNA
jgi:putative ABC transport system permease protein